MSQPINVTVAADLTTSKAERQLQVFLRKAEASSLNLRINDRHFSQPLGRITGATNEFNKSLAASNARVLAFAASAGLMFTVQRGLVEIAKAAIQVEKSLTDINVILNVSKENLHKFGSELFSIANNTGQAFSTVAEAATEFSRQGLSMEKILLRTNDAMILTRLSGMSAASSVQALTAAMNTFSDAALTSTEIINKMANVDAAFAVSTNDLSEALKRVGSSAQDAGVSFDELLAMVATAQQMTARGGAVIGNSLKSIFTRIQRTEVLEQLQLLGVAVKGARGEMLPAISIMSNLAQTMDKLSEAQKSQITEMMGGVFQINIVKAVLGDLGKKYSIYQNALDTANDSTDEAIKRNERLNETLDTLVNKTFQNVKKAAAAIGQLAIAPALERVLEKTNLGLEFLMGDPKEASGMGDKIGKGIVEGLGKFISGPGLIMIAGLLFKLSGTFSKFALGALKDFFGLNKAASERLQIEKFVNKELQHNTDLLKKIEAGEISVSNASKQILKNIEARIAAQTRYNHTLSDTVSLVMAGGGMAERLVQNDPTSPWGVTSIRAKRRSPFSQPLPGASQGYVPNLVKHELSSASYATHNTRAIIDNLPGIGPHVRNSKETLAYHPSFRAPFINPPKGSTEGIRHRAKSKKELGIDPYSLSQVSASTGMIPNFAKSGLGWSRSDEMPEDFRRKFPLSQAQMTAGRMYSPDVRKMLRNLLDGSGKLDRNLLDKLIARDIPIQEIIPASSSLDLPDRRALTKALKDNQTNRVQKLSEIPAGSKIDIRQDVPSMINHGVGVVKTEGPGGVTSYDPFVVIDDPRMMPDNIKKNPKTGLTRKENLEKTSLKIGAGGEKVPLLKISGLLSKDQSLPKDLQDWSQVGFNPDRHSYYYDRKTGEPVTSGDKAVQVGNTVFFKNPKFGNKEDFLYSQGHVPNFAGQKFRPNVELGDVLGSGSYKTIFGVRSIQQGLFDNPLSNLNPDDLVAGVLRRKVQDFEKQERLHKLGAPVPEIYAYENVLVPTRYGNTHGQEPSYNKKQAAIIEKVIPLDDGAAISIGRMIGRHQGDVIPDIAGILTQYLKAKGYIDSYRTAPGWGGIKGDLTLRNLGVKKGFDANYAIDELATLAQLNPLNRLGPGDISYIDSVFSNSGLTVLDTGYLNPRMANKGFAPSFAKGRSLYPDLPLSSRREGLAERFLEDHGFGLNLGGPKANTYEYLENGQIRAHTEYVKNGKVGLKQKTFAFDPTLKSLRDWMGYSEGHIPNHRFAKGSSPKKAIAKKMSSAISRLEASELLKSKQFQSITYQGKNGKVGVYHSAQHHVRRDKLVGAEPPPGFKSWSEFDEVTGTLVLHSIKSGEREAQFRRFRMSGIHEIHAGGQVIPVSNFNKGLIPNFASFGNKEVDGNSPVALSTVKGIFSQTPQLREDLGGQTKAVNLTKGVLKRQGLHLSEEGQKDLGVSLRTNYGKRGGLASAGFMPNFARQRQIINRAKNTNQVYRIDANNKGLLKYIENNPKVFSSLQESAPYNSPYFLSDQFYPLTSGENPAFATLTGLRRLSRHMAETPGSSLEKAAVMKAIENRIINPSEKSKVLINAEQDIIQDPSLDTHLLKASVPLIERLGVGAKDTYGEKTLNRYSYQQQLESISRDRGLGDLIKIAKRVAPSSPALSDEKMMFRYSNQDIMWGGKSYHGQYHPSSDNILVKNLNDVTRESHVLKHEIGHLLDLSGRSDFYARAGIPREELIRALRRDTKRFGRSPFSTFIPHNVSEQFPKGYYETQLQKDQEAIAEIFAHNSPSYDYPGRNWDKKDQYMRSGEAPSMMREATKRLTSSVGFVPNFADHNRVREAAQSGLSIGQTYTSFVDTPKYKGLVIGNKRDEPTHQALRAAVMSHPDPANAGRIMSDGFIPGFAKRQGPQNLDRMRANVGAIDVRVEAWANILKQLAQDGGDFSQTLGKARAALSKLSSSIKSEDASIINLSTQEKGLAAALAKRKSDLSKSHADIGAQTIRQQDRSASAAGQEFRAALKASKNDELKEDLSNNKTRRSPDKLARTHEIRTSMTRDIESAAKREATMVTNGAKSVAEARAGLVAAIRDIEAGYRKEGKLRANSALTNKQVEKIASSALPAQGNKALPNTAQRLLNATNQAKPGIESAEKALFAKTKERLEAEKNKGQTRPQKLIEESVAETTARNAQRDVDKNLKQQAALEKRITSQQRAREVIVGKMEKVNQRYSPERLGSFASVVPFSQERKDFKVLRDASRQGVAAPGLSIPETRARFDQVRTERNQRFQGAAMTASFVAPMLASSISNTMKEDNFKGKAVAEGIGDVAMFGGMGAQFGRNAGIAGVVVGGVLALDKYLNADFQNTMHNVRKASEKAGEKLNHFQNATQSYIQGVANWAQELEKTNVDPQKAEKRRLEMESAMLDIPKEFQSKIRMAGTDMDRLKDTFEEIRKNLAMTAKQIEIAASNFTIIDRETGGTLGGIRKAIDLGDANQVFEPGFGETDKKKRSLLKKSFEETLTQALNKSRFVGDEGKKRAEKMQQVAKGGVANSKEIIDFVQKEMGTENAMIFNNRLASSKDDFAVLAHILEKIGSNITKQGSMSKVSLTMIDNERRAKLKLIDAEKALIEVSQRSSAEIFAMTSMMKGRMDMLMGISIRTASEQRESSISVARGRLSVATPFITEEDKIGHEGLISMQEIRDRSDSNFESQQGKLASGMISSVTSQFERLVQESIKSTVSSPEEASTDKEAVLKKQAAANLTPVMMSIAKKFADNINSGQIIDPQEINNLIITELGKLVDDNEKISENLKASIGRDLANYLEGNREDLIKLSEELRRQRNEATLQTSIQREIAANTKKLEAFGGIQSFLSKDKSVDQILQNYESRIFSRLDGTSVDKGRADLELLNIIRNIAGGEVSDMPADLVERAVESRAQDIRNQIEVLRRVTPEMSTGRNNGTNQLLAGLDPMELARKQVGGLLKNNPEEMLSDIHKALLAIPEKTLTATSAEQAFKKALEGVQGNKSDIITAPLERIAKILIGEKAVTEVTKADKTLFAARSKQNQSGIKASSQFDQVRESFLQAMNVLGAVKPDGNMDSDLIREMARRGPNHRSYTSFGKGGALQSANSINQLDALDPSSLKPLRDMFNILADLSSTGTLVYPEGQSSSILSPTFVQTKNKDQEETGVISLGSSPSIFKKINDQYSIPKQTRGDVSNKIKPLVFENLKMSMADFPGWMSGWNDTVSTKISKMVVDAIHAYSQADQLKREAGPQPPTEGAAQDKWVEAQKTAAKSIALGDAHINTAQEELMGRRAGSIAMVENEEHASAVLNRIILSLSKGFTDIGQANVLDEMFQTTISNELMKEYQEGVKSFFSFRDAADSAAIALKRLTDALPKGLDPGQAQALIDARRAQLSSARDDTKGSLVSALGREKDNSNPSSTFKMDFKKMTDDQATSWGEDYVNINRGPANQDFSKSYAVTSAEPRDFKKELSDPVTKQKGIEIITQLVEQKLLLEYLAQRANILGPSGDKPRKELKDMGVKDGDPKQALAKAGRLGGMKDQLMSTIFPAVSGSDSLLTLNLRLESLADQIASLHDSFYSLGVIAAQPPAPAVAPGVSKGQSATLGPTNPEISTEAIERNLQRIRKNRQLQEQKDLEQIPKLTIRIPQKEKSKGPEYDRTQELRDVFPMIAEKGLSFDIPISDATIPNGMKSLGERIFKQRALKAGGPTFQEESWLGTIDEVAKSKNINAGELRDVITREGPMLSFDKDGQAQFDPKALDEVRIAYGQEMVDTLIQKAIERQAKAIKGLGAAAEGARQEAMIALSEVIENKNKEINKLRDDHQDLLLDSRGKSAGNTSVDQADKVSQQINKAEMDKKKLESSRRRLASPSVIQPAPNELDRFFKLFVGETPAGRPPEDPALLKFSTERYALMRGLFDQLINVIPPKLGTKSDQDFLKTPAAEGSIALFREIRDAIDEKGKEIIGTSQKESWGTDRTSSELKRLTFLKNQMLAGVNFIGYGALQAEAEQALTERSSMGTATEEDLMNVLNSYKNRNVIDKDNLRRESLRDIGKRYSPGLIDTALKSGKSMFGKIENLKLNDQEVKELTQSYMDFATLEAAYVKGMGERSRVISAAQSHFEKLVASTGLYEQEFDINPNGPKDDTGALINGGRTKIGDSRSWWDRISGAPERPIWKTRDSSSVPARELIGQAHQQVISSIYQKRNENELGTANNRASQEAAKDLSQGQLQGFEAANLISLRETENLKVSRNTKTKLNALNENYNKLIAKGNVNASELARIKEEIFKAIFDGNEKGILEAYQEAIKFKFKKEGRFKEFDDYLLLKKLGAADNFTKDEFGQFEQRVGSQTSSLRAQFDKGEISRANMHKAIEGIIAYEQVVTDFMKGRASSRDLISGADRNLETMRETGGDTGEAFREAVKSRVGRYGKNESTIALQDITLKTIDSFESNLGDAFTNAITGAKKVKDAFKDMADAMLNEITKMSIQAATRALMGGLGLGEFSKGGLVKKFARGGLVTGGSGVKDDVPALLNRGEFVVRRSSVNKFGSGLFQALNENQNLQRFASGGIVELGSTDKEKLNLTSVSNPEEPKKSTIDPQAGLISQINHSANSADIILRNAFVYDHDQHPTLGGSRLEIDDRLSRQALSDTENPQNQFRMKKQQGLMNYLQDVERDKEAHAEAMEAYYDAKQARWRQAGINVLLSLGLGYHAKANSKESMSGPNFRTPKFMKNSSGGLNGKDDIPALLTAGEYVMSRDSVMRYGSSTFEKLNSGRYPERFAQGGIVGDSPISGETGLGGAGANNINITVNIDQGSRVSANVDSEKSSNTSLEGQQNAREFSRKIEQAVVKVILDQKRQGGILSS